jgi:hypothetical protein
LSGDGYSSDQDVTKALALTARAGGPNCRGGVSGLGVKREDDAGFDEGFEGKKLALQGLAVVNRETVATETFKDSHGGDREGTEFVKVSFGTSSYGGIAATEL